MERVILFRSLWSTDMLSLGKQYFFTPGEI